MHLTIGDQDRARQPVRRRLSRRLVQRSQELRAGVGDRAALVSHPHNAGFSGASSSAGGEGLKGGQHLRLRLSRHFGAVAYGLALRLIHDDDGDVGQAAAKLSHQSGVGEGEDQDAEPKAGATPMISISARRRTPSAERRAPARPRSVRSAQWGRRRWRCSLTDSAPTAQAHGPDRIYSCRSWRTSRR